VGPMCQRRTDGILSMQERMHGDRNLCRLQASGNSRLRQRDAAGSSVLRWERMVGKVLWRQSSRKPQFL
jgi:hypothetical protein